MNCLVKKYNSCRRVGNTYIIIFYYNYDSDSGPDQQLHPQSSPGGLAGVKVQMICKFSQNCKLGHSCARVTNLMGRLYES